MSDLLQAFPTVDRICEEDKFLLGVVEGLRQVRMMMAVRILFPAQSGAQRRSLMSYLEHYPPKTSLK